MQISLYGFGGLLVSLGGTTTSVGGILNLASSSVLCSLVIMGVPLFLSLSLSFSLSLMLLLFVLLGEASSLLMIPGGVPLVPW